MSADELSADILLYVALAEEFNVVSKHMEEYLKTELNTTELKDITFHLFTANVPSPVLQRDIKLAIAPAGNMGNTRAASAVSSILARLNCNHVVVLGIAGSLSDDLQPGDVLIPSSVVDYFANAATSNDERNETWGLETSPASYQTSSRLLSRFQGFESIHKEYFKRWEDDCALRYSVIATADIRSKMGKAGFTMRDEIKLFAGDNKKLASGSFVGKSDKFSESLKKLDRKLVALEMESAGVYDAAAIRDISPQVLAIRGISDFADERKKLIEDGIKGKFREVAIKNSLSLLLRGIEAGFFEPIAAQDAESDKWTRIRQSSNEWQDQIHTTLPNGLALPRADEFSALQKVYSDSAGAYLLGESGSGKSALLKLLAKNAVDKETEVVWIKAEHFSELYKEIPDLAEVLLNTERSSGLLVIDSLENCYTQDQFDPISRLVASISGAKDSIWKVFLSCQTRSWSRVSAQLSKNLFEQQILSKRIECGSLSDDDFDVVLRAAPTIHNLESQRRMKRFLRSPKMLDLLLRNKSGLNRLLIGEVDVIEWWWNEQVKEGKDFSGEEYIARTLAIHLADSLTSEASPDVVKHDHEATNSLIKKQILSRTKDDRIRFDHDLLADWARVMHLRSLGPDVLSFILEHSENPPWLRAVRLFSQHLLDRASDHERWRSIMNGCMVAPSEQEELAPRNLLILDAWLEGIAYCSDPLALLERNRDQLFAEKAWLFNRLLGHLLHSATVPDPVIQSQFQKIDPSTADSAALHYRLPIFSLWHPFISFLVANSEEVTESLPVTLAKLGLMWERFTDYLELNWSELAELMILNGEKEFRREVAEVSRHNSEAGSLGREKNSRVMIYSATLRAASQHPDRVSKLALKAAGRRNWDDGDEADRAKRGWRGEWYKIPFPGMPGRVIYPVDAWSNGPCRSISSDFYQAWFESGASLPLFKTRPMEACEATLAFLIDWPKTKINKGDRSNRYTPHGFRFESSGLEPAFWASGPFIRYLRANWLPAIDLITRLANFATDRYEEWWPHYPEVRRVRIKTPVGQIELKGNNDVFAWAHYHMNTSRFVTCALMALEKWLDEKIEAGESITDAIHFLYRNGRSLALVGVLIRVGKRYPILFTEGLRPLLFIRDLYDLDLTAVLKDTGIWHIPNESRLLLKERLNWNELPGRKVWLKRACIEWMLTRPEFLSVFEEVSSAWNREAEALPADSQEKQQVLRWAVEFDPQLWRRTELEDGKIEFANERLNEFRDTNAEEIINAQSTLLSLPFQCRKILDKRQILDTASCEHIWELLKDVEFFDRAEVLHTTGPKDSDFLDGRHARAGLIAVIVCLGEKWLQAQPFSFEFIDAEIKKIFNDPPKTTIYSDQDTHDDYEGFLARAAVRRWAAYVNDPDWRLVIARFVTAFRYRTVEHLFDEAYRCRAKLAGACRELEALALSFSSFHQDASQADPFRTENAVDNLINTWEKKWFPRFAKGKGPQWSNDWASIEVAQFPRNLDHGWWRLEYTKRAHLYLTWAKNVLQELGFEKLAKRILPSRIKAEQLMTLSSSQKRYTRIEYGLDMYRILASFGNLPRLSDASDSSERGHWLSISREILAAFLRTLPVNVTDISDDFEWSYSFFSADQNIFELVASRLFECSADERQEFWKPVIGLPPAAHDYINQFLNIVLLESLRAGPPNIEQLIEIWVPFADHIAAQEIWANSKYGDAREVWKVILLLETAAMAMIDGGFAPLVQSLAIHYRNYLTMIKCNPLSQSAFASFLTTEAANPIFINALEWLDDTWKGAKSYFWGKGLEYGSFEKLLAFCWKSRFAEIRQSPKALSAFKTLTLNLAIHNSAVAIDIQNHVGGSDTK